MRYYRFKTFVTSYYFPEITNETRFMLFLYGNYGGILAKIYWYLFCHSSIFRYFHRIESRNIEDFDSIATLLGEDSVFAINYGTPNQEQKKSILGYDRNLKRKFFAKYATKEAAKELTRNEISIYKVLAESGLVPLLYDYEDSTDYVYMKCQCIEGEHVQGKIDIAEVLKVLYRLSGFHYPNPDSVSEKYGLRTCLAHCDFCQWNIIKQDSGLFLIDWELSQERPLGFDLFTFVFINTFGQNHSVTPDTVFENNKNCISAYFKFHGISDWMPYLYAFIDIKSEWLVKNNDEYYRGRLNHLLHYCREMVDNGNN